MDEAGRTAVALSIRETDGGNGGVLRGGGRDKVALSMQAQTLLPSILELFSLAIHLKRPPQTARFG